MRRNPCRQSISEQQWIELLDGTLAASVTRQVQRHLADCAECMGVLEELVSWRDSLLAEGARLRAQCRLSDQREEALIDHTVAQLRRLRGSAFTVPEAITILRFLMEPICGPGAAKAAVNLAILRSAEGDRLSEGNWRLFVRNLSEATALICGLAAGRLVNRAGGCLAIEER